jgi:hypothetical protein
MQLVILALLLGLVAAYQPDANGQPNTTTTDNQGTTAKQPTELDLPVDDSIKVSISPVQVSHVVDHVVEPCIITVRCPEALSAQVFMVPVDAPYGGRGTDKPHLIGTDNNPKNNGFKVRWASKETSRYVKIFAVVRKRSAPLQEVRSLTVDIGIAGSRFDPQP